MANNPFATPSDVAAVWRPLTDAEFTVAASLLRYASMLIRAAVPLVDEWVADGSLEAPAPQYVAVELVRRRMLNPEGHRNGSVSIDDFQRSWTIDSARSVGGLTLTDDLMDWLRPGGAPKGAFTIRGTAPRRACDAEPRVC